MTLEPSDSAPAPRWSVERRLALVLARLQWEGRVNRGDLVKRFGISPNQATADMKRFGETYPGALVYDAKEKTYRAGPGLPEAMPDDAAGLLRDLRLVAEGVLPGDEIALAAVPLLAAVDAPARLAAPAVLRAVLAAIRTRAVLNATYQSFSSPKPPRRRLEPHALVFDGFRWHARSRDVDDGNYKDFVLGRLADGRVDKPATAEPVDDVDWRTKVELDIRPHPALTSSQRRAVESDYGMVGGRILLKCRAAIVYYTKRRLGLMPGHEGRDPSDQHIILKREIIRRS